MWKNYFENFLYENHVWSFEGEENDSLGGTSEGQFICRRREFEVLALKKIKPRRV